MKRKKLNNKPALNKLTVANLDRPQQEQIKGGSVMVITVGSCLNTLGALTDCVVTKPPRCAAGTEDWDCFA